ncbi:hypothetical protein [Solitalea longa]|uniref:hypothetical protein n=1 Tax=Solitalea longa TaxID=2079460 RepID=UPI001A9CB392|nr:hypothetical protein [Solitalea longa]
MDENLQQMNKDELVKEVIKLRMGISEHCDSIGQNLCWHHPKLLSLLPEKIDPKISVPEWSEFMKGCINIESRLIGFNPCLGRIGEYRKEETGWTLESG